MVLPLHGVSSAVSCSGTLDQGSHFRFRDPSNYSVVVVIWTFVGRATYMSPVIGARCCKAWGIHPVVKNTCFCYFSDSRFVIRAIYLPSLFQPLPRWWTITRESPKIWPGNYIWFVNIVRFTFVTCPPSMNPVEAVPSWKAQDGISEHPTRGGLHGGATLVGCSWFNFQSIDSHWILQRVMIFQSWPIPHKLCIVNHQGWSSLLLLFKLKR